MKILIVEDTEDARVLLEEGLSAYGYELQSAVNGIDALKTIRASHPDIIVSDILMPAMDGFELCRQVKRDPTLKNIPFIFYTATYTNSEDERLAMSLGASRFIIKPIEPAELRAIIEEVMAEQGSGVPQVDSGAADADAVFHEQHAFTVARKLDKKIHELEDKNALLEKNERELGIVIDAVPMLIAHVDNDLRYRYVNKAYETWHNLKRREMVGRTVEGIVGEDAWRSIEPYVLRASKGETVEYETEMTLKTGEVKVVWVKYAPNITAKGELDGFISLVNDVTEQRKMQHEQEALSQQLLQAQKMDALGKLTGGIAHDYNNLLGIIHGYAELLNIHLPHDSKLAKYAYDIQRAAERGAKLTKKLLVFSRHKVPDVTVLNINTLLHDQQHMLEKTLTARIKLVLDLADNLWPVELDSGDLGDAIVNMSINAMHAMETGGELTFRTSNEQLNTIDAQQLHLNAGDYVLLSITDTGCGMDDATKEKIFDPFYTTKGERGTGLGLSQAYGFVERSGGAIKVYSEPGHGTRFALYFPRSHQNVTETQTSTIENARNLRGSETLLVVDDEQALVELAHAILTAQGYRVLTANDGEQALKVVEQEAVDLIISDVVMPNMDGYQLAAQVQQRYPHIKLQMVSGFSDNRHNNMADDTLHQNMLYKPYASNTLLARVRSLLDESGTKDTLAGRTILVMDDEVDVQELFKLNLERLGCKTVPAWNGDEAIALYQQSLESGESIDAIILDLSIPGSLNGKDIADKIRALDPNARIVVASGHSEGPEMTHYQDYGFQGALEKHFDRNKIKQVLEKVLLSS